MLKLTFLILPSLIIFAAAACGPALPLSAPPEAAPCEQLLSDGGELATCFAQELDAGVLVYHLDAAEDVHHRPSK